MTSTVAVVYLHSEDEHLRGIHAVYTSVEVAERSMKNDLISEVGRDEILSDEDVKAEKEEIEAMDIWSLTYSHGYGRYEITEETVLDT